MRNKHREWKRKGVFNKHHLRPRSRGGQSLDSNLLRMDANRHDAWHLLFKNLTLSEVIKLLERLKKVKKNEEVRAKLTL